MQGTELTPAPHEVLHQILGELRDFRTEFNERSVPNEGAGLVGPRVPAVQIGNEHVQANPNHPLPFLPPNLPTRPVPAQNGSMPGEFPSNPPLVERDSEVCPESHQHLSDVERAKIESYYHGEMGKLLDEIQAKKELWEESRQKNAELSIQLTEQKTKVVNLQRLMTRAGRNENTAIDGDIIAQFVQLKIEILQMVKTHFVVNPDKQAHPEASSDLPELYLRTKLALALYEKFFSRKALPFGYEDHMLEKSPMRKFEETLRKANCDESAIRDWRVATVKACKLLDRGLEDYAMVISDKIWSETLSSYRKSHMKQINARKDLDSLCIMAAGLAIMFRSSAIEYEWEQDTSRLNSLEVNTKDHEITGTKGPQPNEESNFQIAFVVFGGVVRGDKSTGLLENGRMRLSKTHVVIGRPKS